MFVGGGSGEGGGGVNIIGCCDSCDGLVAVVDVMSAVVMAAVVIIEGVLDIRYTCWWSCWLEGGGFVMVTGNDSSSNFV